MKIKIRTQSLKWFFIHLGSFWEDISTSRDFSEKFKIIMKKTNIVGISFFWIFSWIKSMLKLDINEIKRWSWYQNTRLLSKECICLIKIVITWLSDSSCDLIEEVISKAFLVSSFPAPQNNFYRQYYQVIKTNQKSLTSN